MSISDDILSREYLFFFFLERGKGSYPKANWFLIEGFSKICWVAFSDIYMDSNGFVGSFKFHRNDGFFFCFKEDFIVSCVSVIYWGFCVLLKF